MMTVLLPSTTDKQLWEGCTVSSWCDQRVTASDVEHTGLHNKLDVALCVCEHESRSKANKSQAVLLRIVLLQRRTTVDLQGETEGYEARSRLSSFANSKHEFDRQAAV